MKLHRTMDLKLFLQSAKLTQLLPSCRVLPRCAVGCQTIAITSEMANRPIRTAMMVSENRISVKNSDGPKDSATDQQIGSATGSRSGLPYTMPKTPCPMRARPRPFKPSGTGQDRQGIGPEQRGQDDIRNIAGRSHPIRDRYENQEQRHKTRPNPSRICRVFSFIAESLFGQGVRPDVGHP